MDWHNNIVACLRLERLWNEGYSTAEIGRMFGVSKNSIIGAAHRLNLPKRHSPIRHAGVYGPPTFHTARKAKRRFGVYGPPTHEQWLLTQRSNGVPAPRKTLPKLASETLKPIAVRVYKEPPPPPRVIVGRPCSWPIGEPRTLGFRFCDAPSLFSKSYCPEHYAAAHTRKALKPQSASVVWNIKVGLGRGI